MRKTFVLHLCEKLRHVSHQSFLLSVVGQSSHFDGNIRIQDKIAINSDASDFTFSYRIVVQIELVSEVVNAKKLVFAYYHKLRNGSHQSILLSAVGQSSHFDGNFRIQEKMAIHFDA